MFHNYLKVTIKNLLRDKLSSFINIAGFSVGLAACLLIALYVQDETSWDKHWENAEQIYRLNTILDIRGDGPQIIPISSGAAISGLKQAFPGEIELGTRVIEVVREVQIGDARFEESVATVDIDFIRMFGFETLAGDLEAALSDPGQIALSSESAERFFGEEDPIGRTVTLTYRGVSLDYVVSAVYRQPRGNSVLNIPVMNLFDEAQAPDFYFNWMLLTMTSYVKLAPGVEAGQLGQRLATFTDQNIDITSLGAGPDVDPSERYGFDLQNITEIHLKSLFDDSRPGGNPTVVLAFSAIAVLVLLIGCINFTLLSTAKSTRRAKEVAMRKVVGAGKGQLVAQYLGEAFFIVFPALLLALLLVELTMPGFEAMVGKRLAISYFAAETWVSMLVVLGAVTLLSGLYPAFVLSRFRPSGILKANQCVETSGSVSLRNALVIFQFSVAIALMVATAVIYFQVNYSNNRDPGFNKDNLLVIDSLRNRPDIDNLKEAMKQEVAALPGVDAVSLSIHQPMQRGGLASNFMGYRVEGSSGEQQNIATLSVDADFFRTYQIPLIEGRYFDESRDRPTPIFQDNEPETPVLTNIIVNESTVRELGFTNSADAVGTRILLSLNGETHPFSIIGVASDTQFYSLNAIPRAEVYIYAPDRTDVLTVRYFGDTQVTLSRVEEIWTSVMGDAELSMSLVEQNMFSEFDQQRTEARLLVSFSLLAILISCLGLYGSAAFTVERRTKEIGIRKVMGAEVREIVTLLMWQFSIPVLLANVIAWPAVLWAMLIWLQKFPYQIDALLMVPLCVLAGFIALSIAWLTVAGNTVKVATTNPVYALRYE